uniref:Uncharacterized protein n=1 Tax=Octopus bimaculoides TaxID=37653 RepID=A0A0L8GE77_OCTBM
MPPSLLPLIYFYISLTNSLSSHTFDPFLSPFSLSIDCTFPISLPLSLCFSSISLIFPLHHHPASILRQSQSTRLLQSTGNHSNPLTFSQTLPNCTTDRFYTQFE